MKWCKKKPSSAAAAFSSRPFSISQVLPTSWTTKFKQMSISSGQKHAKVKQKGTWNSTCTTTDSSNGGGKFYGGDGDAFWRLSFGDDSVDDSKTRGVLRSVRYSSDDDLDFPLSRVNGDEETKKFSNTVSHVKKIRGLPEEVEIVQQMQTCVSEKVAEIRTPRLKVERDKILRKSEEKQLQLDKAEGFQRKTVARRYGVLERVDCKLAAVDSTTERDSFSYRRKIEKDCVFAAENENYGFSAENFSSKWQKLKEKKVEEFKSRNAEQRKSLYISRELQRKRTKHNNKVRVYSPRTSSRTEISKIKALEDMKMAKLKTKKKAKEKTILGFKGLESFAVVKCSYNPQKDFRDSMIEMIKEQRISRPEELEELLACYLTLNSDEYHDLIIRVFRQVWFDLNQACFDTELENEE